MWTTAQRNLTPATHQPACMQCKRLVALPLFHPQRHQAFKHPARCGQPHKRKPTPAMHQLACMHSSDSKPFHPLIYRDIKLENILLDVDNHLKLIDFGLSAFFLPGKPLRVNCGSPSYAAPEIVARKPYDGPPVVSQRSFFMTRVVDRPPVRYLRLWH